MKFTDVNTFKIEFNSIDKKNLCLFSILLINVTFTSLKAQDSSHELSSRFELDTVLFLPFTPVSSDLSVSVQIAGNSQFTVCHPFKETKSNVLTFYFIDNSTFKTNIVRLSIPDFSENIQNTYVYSMAYLNKWLVLCFDKKLLILELNPSITLKSHKYINLDRSMRNMFIHSDTLIMGNVYNHQDGLSSVYIGTLNMQNGKLIKSIAPPFSCPEFSHFQSYSWITVSDKNIFLSQTVKPQIDVYNLNLEKVSSIHLNIPNWVAVDEKRMVEFKKSIPKNQIIPLLDSIEFNFNKSISRVEAIWSLNDSIIMLRYYKYDKKADFNVRFIDEYQINSSLVFEFKNTFVDCYVPKKNIQDTVTPYNYDLMTWNYFSKWGNNYVCQLRPSSPDLPLFGKPWNVMIIDMQKFYEKNSPKTGVYFFKYRP